MSNVMWPTTTVRAAHPRNPSRLPRRCRPALPCSASRAGSVKRRAGVTDTLPRAIRDLPLDLETDFRRLQLLRQWNGPFPSVQETGGKGLKLLQLPLSDRLGRPSGVRAAGDVEG